MHEEISVESSRVQETPALREASHVAAVPLAEALVRLPAQNRLQSDRMGSSMVVGLDVKLNSFSFLKRMALELGHDSLSTEE